MGRSASPRPGKSNATPRSPCSASAGITLRYRKELVGTPCSEDDRSPLALLAHEAPHAAGREAPARRLVASIASRAASRVPAIGA